MFCNTCGTSLPENTAICHVCGNVPYGNSQPAASTTAEQLEELEYLETRMKLHKMKTPAIIAGIVGAVLGFYGSSVIMGPGASQISVISYAVYTLLFVVMGAYLVACIPYAWSILPFYALGFYGLMIKLVIALWLGYIITPIGLALNIRKCRKYERAHGMR